VPAGQEVTLQPSLTLVLAQNLHHPAVGGEVVVVRVDLGGVAAAGHLQHILPAIGVVLVGAEEAKVPAIQVPLVGVPARRQGPGLGLAVADDASDDQVGVVEGGAVGVGQGIAELTPLVDRAGRLGGDVAGDSTGEAELCKQPLHPLLVLADIGVNLAVGALEADIGDQPRSPVPRAGDVDHGQVVLLDDPLRWT